MDPYMQFILYYLISGGVIDVGSMGQSFVLHQYVYRGTAPVSLAQAVHCACIFAFERESDSCKELKRNY